MTATSCLQSVELSTEIRLSKGWEMAAAEDPAPRDAPGSLRFVPAQVPGTVASALRGRRLWRMGDGVTFDNREYWFRCRFDATLAEHGEEIVLRMGGIATIADVWLNGEAILHSDSMFATHQVEVSHLICRSNELLIACHPLSTALREKRGRQPAARWKTRVVGQQQLRWFRTTLLGRAPGFSAEPEAVGPWRPVALVRRRMIAIENWSREVSLDQVSLENETGVVRVQFRMRVLEGGARPVSGSLASGDMTSPLEWNQAGAEMIASAELRIPNADRWWPHTHGRPVLYPLRVDVQLADGTVASFEDVPVGFRSIDAGLPITVNGTRVFCRGVIWTPPDVASLAADPSVTRERLRLLRDGGFNMVRLAGTMVYEDEAFHSFCDELGLMVWQDMMFANMDYPCEDAAFRETIRAEAETELMRFARHCSSAVICGNSEVEQQAGMLGLDAAAGRGAFFGQDLPCIAERCCPGLPYVPSAPCGGDQPFRTRSGVANYFGVGAYLRPLSDVRRAEVQFASECLAFANVPEPEALEEIAAATPGGLSLTHPIWKRGVPRDSGTNWDFEDVRDFYLRLLYSTDPGVLRYSDADRYLELSRMVSGEVMAEVFGEWRRPASGCGGGIILWGSDLHAGAGWGILDHRGQPKAAWWFLKRALSPQTVWMTDEGLNGIDIHIANDCAETMVARLRVALYRFDGRKLAESHREIAVPARDALTLGAEELLGRFVDVAYAYRFGPPGHELVVASLHQGDGDALLAQAFRFPVQHPTGRAPVSEIGLEGEARLLADGSLEVLLSSRRFAWGVRVGTPGYVPDDNYFSIEPAGKRRVMLAVTNRAEKAPANIAVVAANAEGRVIVPCARPA